MVSNDWTLKPKKIDIRKVYFDTRLHRRKIEAHGVELKPIQDLSEMLQEVKMGEEIPQRVLLQGNLCNCIENQKMYTDGTINGEVI